MRKALVLLLLLVFLSVQVQAEELHYATSLTLTQEINTGIQIIPKTTAPQVQSAALNLYLFAQDDARQQIIQTYYGEGFSTQEENHLTYDWLTPTDLLLPVEIEQQIQTTALRIPIKQKISFPLQNLSPEVASYVAFTEHIDRSSEISAVAQSLASGEDDLFKLQTKIGQWVVEHITYNLSTITADANQPSSLVIEQGYGVCDEITNLFLSINRELGIPARFVSGIAYSESILFDTKWRNHGWAEVYFPDVGWVPYDITYQQFAWIDPTHISFSKEVDGVTPALKTQTIGFGYEFATLPLTFSTEVLSKGSKSSPYVQLQVKPFLEQVGIGSFNAIEVEVYNPQSFYVSEKITLIPTTDLVLLNPSATQHVALAPKERAKIIWQVQVNENLTPQYRYTFPIGVQDGLANEVQSEFFVQDNYPFIAQEQLPVIKDAVDTTRSVICEGPGEVLVQTSAGIACYLPEDASRVQQVCLGKNCQMATFTQNASFAVDTSNVGIFTRVIDIGTKEDIIVSYRVSDIPFANITQLKLSGTDSFAVPVQLSFVVEKTSYSIPKNVVISISHELFSQEYELESLQRNQPVSLAIPSQLFALGWNELVLTVKVDGRVVDEQILAIESKPETASDYLYASINYANRILARKGVASVEARSIITLGVAGLVTFVFYQLLFRLLRKALLNKP